MNRKATLRQIPQLIANREPFVGNSMSARNDVSTTSSGRLTGTDREKFHEDNGRLTYVVYSYATPIAWQTTDGAVHIAAQRFSVTTSKHQGKVRYGFSL